MHIDLGILLRLSGIALIPVVASILFFLLEKYTVFGRQGKVLKIAKHGIIGVIFGIIAIMGTIYGVDVGGATANARDAAPLCAGLLFGAPEGIIAGVIGGGYRFVHYIFAGINVASDYSRIACSISTVLAGVFAAFLRKFMFDDRRTGWGFGLMSGIVMEVVHLSILFLTHLDNPTRAFEIISIVTAPMVLCNAVSVCLSCLIISLLSKDRNKKGGKKIKRIADKVQMWLLICIVLAYAVTTIFVSAVQTGTARASAEGMMGTYISDLQADITRISDNALMSKTESITEAIMDNGGATNEFLYELQTRYNVSAINVINEFGYISESTDDRFIGVDMANIGSQAREFYDRLIRGKTGSAENAPDYKYNYYVQSFRNVSYDVTDDSLAMKYAGQKYGKGMIQVGYDYDRMCRAIGDTIDGMTANRRIGTGGYIVVVDADLNIISDLDGHDAKNLSEYTDILTKDSIEKYIGQFINIDMAKDSAFCKVETAENYYIIGVISESEVYESRDASFYINSFMEVIVFALLFFMIYGLVKKLVVNNIKTVNENLSRIIGGNLDVTVNVRSSAEFASLSDDINSTVTTLKHYIDEAAERIDKELLFAKNIQTSALPSVFPAYPDVKSFDIYATMNTAKEVGGDFYDFYMLGDDKIAFLIADVSGKGIPAAMFMMKAKTLIKNLAESGLPLGQVFTRANEELCNGNEAGMFVTAWMGVLELSSGTVTFVNAGHNPPLIRRNDRYEYFKSRAGFVLAGMEGFVYKEQTFNIEPGDRIFLYTDGVTEATDLNGGLYGEERLCEYLNGNPDMEVSKLLPGVFESVNGFVGEAEQFDDITMLSIYYFGNEDSSVKLNEKIFPASDSELDNVTDFVDCELEKDDCPMKAVTQINIALEEIFVNVAHYAYHGGEGTVKVGVSAADGVATVRFTDSGMPFDPLKKSDPDITLSADERDIGGLGIYMVKKSMDSVDYSYTDGHNVLTFTKKYR